MRSARFLTIGLALAALVAGAARGDNPLAGLSPAALACLKQALPKAALDALVTSGKPEQVLSPAQLARARACVETGGRTSTTPRIPMKGAWIVANPLDLAKVTSISVFRSCSGHDYSGSDVQGQVETDRSMKHYVDTSVPWEPPDTLRGYAPFDGTVATVENEQFPLGKQVRIASASVPWEFIFFHADPLVKAGQKVRAGQPVVAWPPKGALAAFASSGFGKRDGTSFDIALRAVDQTLDSPLLHMTPKVAAQWAAKGFTPASAVVSKAARDAEPCNGTYNRTDGSDFVQARG